ncbi:hypothetical protein [Agreia sp. Leaf283]|uniref:hypothetical protein n=1 Tax=Agreia sp. Leaf283 TaxID=1736321 RepID=UPI000A783103|nr:hypothetical protein [Agreia sp. Leaf283]
MWTPLSDEERLSRALEEYDRHRKEGHYETALQTLKSDLEARIGKDPRIHLHDVQARVKSRGSFEAKVRKDPSRDVEDVLGVRVITYFRDDAKWVEQLIRDMLMIREGTYSNKADKLDDREFGYRSIQFVAEVPPLGYGTTRQDGVSNGILPKALSPNVVEIQIRTVLEHAWAEVEHDVYARRDTPTSRSIRRRFALTAALIENADEQLETLRDALDPDHPGETVLETQTNDGFLQRFYENERSSIELDEKIVTALDLPKGRPPKYDREVSRAVDVAGLDSTEALRSALGRSPAHAVRMAIVCVDVDHSLILPDAIDGVDDVPVAFPGIGLYWLALGLLHEHQKPHVSFNSVSPGRLHEYREVGRYLLHNPAVSALTVRAQYWALRHESGEVFSPNNEFVIRQLD